MSLGLVMLLLAAQPGSPPPAPVPAPPPRSEPEPDIIITGERRPRRMRDTAASVAVFGAADLDRLPAADRLESLLPMVPNIQLGSGGEAPTIRGQDTTGVVRDLPAFLGGTRPRTTLQVWPTGGLFRTGVRARLDVGR